ncbi:sphingosine-1-phosphate phosphatase 2-like [Clavelina lepadiformis]|uniref:sphingosine-1-phosphate phosphatase 2-like n=1 Tax=Clavelina lepadiformis TaxID=159417 RepID=UPI0040419B2E
MKLLTELTDYLMDFQKVRAFQEFCGVKENTSTYGRITNEDENLVNNCCEETHQCFDNGAADLHYKSTKTCFETKKTTETPKLTPKQYEKTYVITNWFLYYLFKFGSTLGHEIFYITFVPCIFWNFDPFIGRKMVVVWVVTMYIGQALKDILQWPRPTWPPVFKLETRVAAEYGLPSTHAVAGTTFPFSMLMAMYNRYDFPLEIGVILACSWCLLVACSRLYVGMHSIMDVLAGISLAATYLWLGWPFMDMVEEYTMTSTFAPWIIIISHFLLGVFYPGTEHYSTSRGDTVIILAAGAGIHCASWFLYQYGIYFGPTGELPYTFACPTFASLGRSALRTILGLVILFMVRMVVKTVSLFLICHAVGVSKNDRQARQRKDVEITYKFVTYAFVGFFALALIPIFFDYINLTH